MVWFLCKDEKDKIAIREGYFLREDLKKVLDESGDPYWVETLIEEFKKNFFNENLEEYYNFSRFIDFRPGYKFYLTEQKRRLEEAYKLKSFKLGRPLTIEEQVQELEENHISKDFRIYFLLEHPECCAINKDKLNSFYREALEWLLVNAFDLNPEKKDYFYLLEKNKSLVS
ncbi:MAG: hypothetical protein QW103_01680 [Candidatus Pacearchaeota archaeon]